MIGQRPFMLDVIDPGYMNMNPLTANSSPSYPTYPACVGWIGSSGSSATMGNGMTVVDQALWLQNLSAMGISPNSLVRISFDPSGVNTNTVYYIGQDGRRHPFIPEQAFTSWSPDLSTVRTIDASQLSRIPLGGPIGYRPGSRIIRFQSSPDLYVAQPDGQLRRLDNDTVASSVYGVDWMNKVDTLSDSYYGAYQFRAGTNVMSTTDYDVNQLQSRYQTPGDLSTNWMMR